MGSPTGEGFQVQRKARYANRGPRPLSLSVIIPAHNEEQCLGQTISQVVSGCADPDNLEIVVVDDASTDGTAEVLRQVLASPPCKIQVVYREHQGGLGGALLSGFEVASNQVLTWLPGDGQTLMRDIAPGLDLYRPGAIVLVRRNSRGQIHRGLVSLGMHVAIRALFGIDLRAFCGSFFIGRTEWRALKISSNSAFFSLEVAITARQRGLATTWISAPVYPRVAGRSSVFRPRVLVASLGDLVGLRLAQSKLGQKRPGSR